MLFIIKVCLCKILYVYININKMSNYTFYILCFFTNVILAFCMGDLIHAVQSD